MRAKTKIVVLHMKEIIYTIVFAILGILLVLLLFFMFSSGDKKQASADKKYTPGIYRSAVTLNNTDLEVEICVKKTGISSIRLRNLDDSVTAMYPLIQPAIEELSEQICKQQSLENIELPKENPYTSQILLNAIEEALKKAAAK